MKFKEGQIVLVKLASRNVHGRVVSVQPHGDGVARFRGETGNAIMAPIMPEMVVSAFWQDGIGAYGV